LGQLTKEVLQPGEKKNTAWLRRLGANNRSLSRIRFPFRLPRLKPRMAEYC
jgi:hypothetical protein